VRGFFFALKLPKVEEFMALTSADGSIQMMNQLILRRCIQQVLDS